MSMSKRNHKAHSRPISKVRRELRAHYLRAARVPDIQQENRSMMVLIADYQALITAGNLAHALGAGLELVDLGLRIAAAPAACAMERAYKEGFFSLHFPSMMQAFDHPHVAMIADAAMAAERTLSAHPTPARTDAALTGPTQETTHVHPHHSPAS